jgi:type III secretion protein C
LRLIPFIYYPAPLHVKITDSYCMKIISIISRFFIPSLAAIQPLIGANSHQFNLDFDDKNPASILRTAKPQANQSKDSFLYDILEPIEFESTHKKQPDAHQDLIAQTPPHARADENEKKVLINFNNVSMVEYVRFVSRISNRNFIFDENDLQFNVTIVSEEPATVENIMAALLQELRIHDLMLIEDNNNLIIHKNPKVSGISIVVPEGTENIASNADIVTQVFRLNTLDADKAVVLLRPLVSDTALIESLKDTNQLIVTDISVNVQKISELLKTLDAPNSGLVIGQYVSRLTPIETLIPLVQQIMLPISLDQTLTFVPQATTNSIFIVASPFLVERSISILEYLDQDQGATRILNLKDLRPGNLQINPRVPLKTLSGQWISNAQGNWMFKPQVPFSPETTPTGTWYKDADGNWNFTQGAAPAPGTPAPRGRWVKDANGNWIYELEGDETPFIPTTLQRQFQGQAQLPGGVQKPTKFFIYKLQYRRGESVEPALRQIADTLQINEKGSEDLINTLRSVQWLVEPNSLVFSGTEENLIKIQQLVSEIDIPMRQVLIEMLILETSLRDSLNYGVNYNTRFGGGDLSGSQGFSTGSNPLLSEMTTAGFTNLGQALTPTPQIITLDGTNLADQTGFSLGVIGRKIVHCGTEFGSIGALVNALHDRIKDKVVSNPKLLVEDGAIAELFVGLNTPYRTQSISNDFGSVITSNFEYRDVGTRLKVTPYLGNGDIIAMDIEEEVSSIVAGLITDAQSANTSPGPTTRINRTVTRVHIPDNYFLIISGMMQNEESRERVNVPCLGGVPLIGAAFASKVNADTGRNLMIFIRPKIIDTEEEIQNITKHNQDIYGYKNCYMNSDEYETVEALDFFNVKKTLHPEDEWECDCDCH